MDLKHLLSILVATLTSLGAILYSMGPQEADFAVGLWIAAICSLVVTDFFGVFRLPRKVASLLMWGVLVFFVLQYALQLIREGGISLTGSTADWQLHIVANVLIFLQGILLFQEKDARTCGWLLILSLLQVVVAARYSRGMAFGSLLVVYTIIGMFALSMLALFGQRVCASLAPRDAGERTHLAPRDDSEHLAERDEYSGRWPLTGARPEFGSTPLGDRRTGVVPELFLRLSLTVVGGLLLATLIFYTAPRPRIPSWRGDSQRSVSVVGFNDKIKLGELGDTIESREEVMRVQLLDADTRKLYPLRDKEIYLRGTVVTWYSRNQWRRGSPSDLRWEPAMPPTVEENLPPYTNDVPESEKDSVLQIGPPVIQSTTNEPDFERFDLFYIWPLVKVPRRLHFASQGERLMRRPTFDNLVPSGAFEFEVTTTGLADGRQAALVPARRIEKTSPLLQMPSEGRELPRLTALAERWRLEHGLKPEEYYKIAQYFERQLAFSGEFHYSLQAVQRDESIDAVEDFVSNNPSGHCEYFATALALMLRSQGIPARVVLGYHCDEWDSSRQCFQVRQLHAHAWVEAFLDPAHLPAEICREQPKRWIYGGWLRLDGTPADAIGTAAADHTTWGKWQAYLHAVQHYWERYIADMDNKKQRESVYDPARRAMSEVTRRFFSWEAWRNLFVGAWTGLAGMFGGGMMGKLAGALLVVVVGAAMLLAAWWLTSAALWLWRRFFRGGLRSSRMRTSVEFYLRFEQVLARCGLLRRAGQTPREFALAAGVQLARTSGRPELAERAAQVAEAFYGVRFGRQELDAAAKQAVQQAIEELKAGAAGPSPPAK